MEIIINTKVPLPEIEFSTSNRRFPEPAGWLIPGPLSDIRINQLCIAIKVRHRTSSSAVASLQPAPSAFHHRAVIHTLRISYSTPNTTILLCLPVSASLNVSSYTYRHRSRIYVLCRPELNLLPSFLCCCCWLVGRLLHVPVTWKMGQRCISFVLSVALSFCLTPCSFSQQQGNV